MTKLEGRVAIVTGAGGGLGRSHAMLLGHLGARVVVNDTNVAAAEAVSHEIAAAGGSAMPFAASVTDEPLIDAMVASAMQAWGRVDILVNNAGILRDRSFAKMTMTEFREVVDVHLMGSAICTKAVWAIMRAQSYGRVVMTTSSSGLFGSFGQANYGAAKMALVGLMQTLALEGEKYDIRVNCLAPTASTAMTDGILSPEASDLFSPGLVSQGLPALVGEAAPTRAILCAGAGHFARAYVTLTHGAFAGDAVGVAERWDAIGAREGDGVPTYGLAQMERELSSAREAEDAWDDAADVGRAVA
ncbi:SDR family NAD(P)-dependent oxidoreductase [Aureimonas jatrophae]|uniref:NAD(P)-dependent dehydrogenase, short-chain alcohol dehydrogenase family n=1 Tax=Aureimonas jatrophae TaxID=1166073 RepID=A0A1H0KCW1_9HYPH|nr:SDR family NAD(P)-dependent oxidoreductase [Aureimonas jatrophae]MBB3951061.1 NAD(P)-dependent dehydrogenase (short-subunit alcohol dehydrogenase family) [Aureimonas jatrophae]SDO53611.1 NAD(P)-dependent dehydrogenase, short-chain alcohol dehydrogenase family [Aureimonas jatrophae]